MVARYTYLVLNTMLVLPINILTTSLEDTTPANNNKFSFYLHVNETKSLASNNSISTAFANGSTITTTPITVCSCSSNLTDSFLANAQQMMNQMVNKTTMLSKIRHRATHSNQAMWASFTLSGLMMLLVVGVLHSKMWNDRTFLSYTDSQPVKFEQYNRKSEILVKDLIRSRGRNLLSMFTKTKKRKKSGNTLQMETFLAGRGDTVDSSHQALLESSDEDFFLESDSESEEETVFKINSRTGQWEGLEAGETEEMTMSLLGGNRRKRNRTSTSSTDSRYSLLNSYVSKDLVRLSDSEVEEEKQFINVG